MCDLPDFRKFKGFHKPNQMNEAMNYEDCKKKNPVHKLMVCYFSLIRKYLKPVDLK